MERVLIEDDLDYRVLEQQASGILAGLDTGVDGSLTDTDFYEPSLNRERVSHRYKEPKVELPERVMIARRKAQNALATVNKAISEGRFGGRYTFPHLVIYFLKNPDAKSKSFLQTAREAQVRRESGATRQTNGNYANIMELFERRLQEYRGYSH